MVERVGSRECVSGKDCGMWAHEMVDGGKRGLEGPQVFERSRSCGFEITT